MRRAARSVAVAVAVALLLGGCTTRPAPRPTLSTPPVTSVATERGLVYRTVDGQRLALDACLPKPARQAAALVLVHGGGFSGGSRADLDFVCRSAAKSGFATFSVDYRLLPIAYPAQVEDVAAAIAWITAATQAARFSIETDRVAVLGTSAGATVAAELATGTPGSGFTPSTLRAVVLMSGFYDFAAPLGKSAPIAPEYLACSTDCAAAGRRASPADHATAGDPPMLLVGSTDELTPPEQLQTFAAALQQAGVGHQTLVEQGDSHAEAVFVTHPASEATVLAFLRTHLLH